MRYSQLRAFHFVAVYGGFSRAAEAMFLTQPAISDQVRKLEQSSDVLLFSRTRKRVQLTEAGRQLLLLTKQLFEIEERIDDYLDEARAEVEGVLRIIAGSVDHFSAALADFRNEYPKVLVSLKSGNTNDVLNALRNYQVEIGVGGLFEKTRDVQSISLDKTPIVPFAARGMFPEDQKPLSLKELSKYPLVARETGSKTRELIQDYCQSIGVTLVPTIEAEGRETVREIVASGAGYGFVSRAEFGHDSRIVEIPLDKYDVFIDEKLHVLTQRKDLRVTRSFLASVERTKNRPAI